MKLKIEKNHNGTETHKGELFEGVAERQYAYQDETISLEFTLNGSDPLPQDGKLNWGKEKGCYSRYELRISRHTGKSLTLKLIAHRNDTVPQRIQNGFAVTADVLIASMSLGELCNRLFSDAYVTHESEAFPPLVREAMKKAYHPRERESAS